MTIYSTHRGGALPARHFLLLFAFVCACGMGNEMEADKLYDQAMALIRIDLDNMPDWRPSTDVSYRRNQLQALLDLKQVVRLYRDAGSREGEAKALRIVGYLETVLNRQTDAIASLQEAILVNKQLYGEESPEIVQSYVNLGKAWARFKEHEKSIGAYEGALTIAQKSLGEGDEALGKLYNKMGDACRALSDPGRAIGYYEKAVSIGKAKHPDKRFLVSALAGLGDSYLAAGQKDKAVTYYEQSAELAKNRAQAQDSAGAGASSLWISFDKLGDVLFEQGQFDRALASYQQVMELSQGASDEEIRVTMDALTSAASCLSSLKRHREAIEYLEKLTALIEKKRGADHIEVAKAHLRIGSEWLQQGQPQQAIEWYERAVDLAEKKREKEHQFIAEILVKMAEAEAGARKYEAAVRLYDRAEAAHKKRCPYPAGCAFTAGLYRRKGTVRADQNDCKRALEHYEHALDLYKQSSDTTPEDIKETKALMANCDGGKRKTKRRRKRRRRRRR